MIDVDGFRPNVGIIVANSAGEVLWARRIGQDAWQFPQGGIGPTETPVAAMYRELREEVGLTPADVRIIACTQGWLKYRLPRRMLRHRSLPVCIGQKQKWFLLRMIGDESCITLDRSATPEFDNWQWVSYWFPLGSVVSFKKEVYRQALSELSPRLAKELQGYTIQHADHPEADRTGSY